MKIKAIGNVVGLNVSRTIRALCFPQFVAIEESTNAFRFLDYREFHAEIDTNSLTDPFKIHQKSSTQILLVKVWSLPATGKI